VPAVGQLVDHGEQPAPAPFVSQPVALYVPVPHATVPAEQPLHELVAAPVHVPVEHTQPEKSAEDEELAGQMPAHADTVLPPVLIAIAWNGPAAQVVQTTSDVAVPALA
jgi:hypothetical protein